MSAPISIPIIIEDDGTAALLKLAGGFDNLWQKGDRLAQQFAVMGRSANAFSTQLELVTKRSLELAGAQDKLFKSQGLLNDGFKAGTDLASSYAKGLGGLVDAQSALLTANQRMVGSMGDIASMYRTVAMEQKVVLDQQLALAGVLRATPGAGPASVLGGGASRTIAADSSAFLRAGSTRIGPANFAGSALGIPVPALAAAVVGYLGYKTVSTSNQYNQSIADIVSQSTQDPTTVPGLQSGVLGLAGGQNRFTPQQMVTGLYPIASSPIFAKQADQIAALKIVSMQAQGSGAGSIKSLASADVGAVSAYGFAPSQMGFVADTISKGVNIGLAESPDFAKGVGTFSAASLAADPNKQRAFQQAVGAFAQQTNLSPRFRFDAQGENAFLQVINKTLTGKSGQLADALGVSQLFGPGAEGRAGGMQAWLGQLQSATGGANQQQYLQGLFGRQNALQFVRGFTGTNFASGQAAISGTSDATGTVLKGARIADAGPQAQWDQIGSQFNKDVIQVGDTISRTLNPALVSLAGSAMTAAGKLGDALGSAGNAIDIWSKVMPWNLPQTTAARQAAVVTNLQTNVANMTPTQRAALAHNFTRYGLNPALVDTQGHLAPMGPPAPARHIVSADFMGPLLPGDVRAPAAPGAMVSGRDYALMHPAGLGTDQALAAYQVAQRQAAANALLSAQQGNNSKLLTADRGAINFALGLHGGQGASNAVLNTAVSKLRADLGASGMTGAGQADYLQKFGTNPVTKVENQRLIDAAQVQYNAATTFEQSVRIHREGLAASNAAAYQVYNASMNLIGVQAKTGALKKTDAATLGLGAQDTLNQQLLTNLTPAMQEAQAGLSLAVATHGNLAGARSGVAAMYRQQAALGAIGPKQLALDLYQLGQQGKIPTPGPQLVRPQELGLGDALAGPGSTIARLSTHGGQDPLAETVRHLQQIIARDEKMIQELQKANDHLVTLTNEVAGSAPAHAAGHPAHNAGSAPRRLMGF